MRLGLVIYGNLEIVTGGFLYDKLVVEYLRRQGDEVEIITLPWHPYALSLGHNFWPYVKTSSDVRGISTPSFKMNWCTRHCFG